jgi:hypothetical protein
MIFQIFQTLMSKLGDVVKIMYLTAQKGFFSVLGNIIVFMYMVCIFTYLIIRVKETCHVCYFHVIYLRQVQLIISELLKRKKNRWPLHFL